MWLSRWLGLGPPREPAPRLPWTMGEARAKYDAWDRLNGRYYYHADVVLDDGRLVRDLCFDAGSDVALIAKTHPELIGRSIRAFLVTSTSSAPAERVSEDERAAFARAHGA